MPKLSFDCVPCPRCEAMMPTAANYCPSCGRRPRRTKAGGSTRTLVGASLLTALLGALAVGALATAPRLRAATHSESDEIRAMKVDLRRLADAERRYHDRFGTYTIDFAEMDEFQFANGVRLVNGFTASPYGWSITVGNSVTSTTCTIHDGPGTPARFEAGVPTCK